MRSIAVFLAISLAALATSAMAIAQVQELPNVPVVSGGWQDKFWTHPDGTKFHYLEWGLEHRLSSSTGRVAPR